SWSDPVEVDACVLRTGVDSLDVRDLDGDGSLELLVHVKKGLEVFRFDDRDPVGNPVLYRDDSERSRGLQFADIDGDGHDDWIYLSPGSDRSVRTRLWRKSGFGPECSHAFSSRSGVNLLPLGMRGKGEPSFVAVEADTEKITLFSVSPKNDPPKDSTVWNPLIRDLFGSGDEEASFTTADFDGDGHLDVIAASPSLAEILFLRGRPTGDFSTPSAFPSFHGISSLVAGRLYEKGGMGLVVVSSKEKLAGVCRHIPGKRFRFPVDLPLKDDPVEVVCADLDSNGLDEILLVAKERYDYLLHRFVADKKGRFSEVG
ncbi:uncharacterized protein METZ01_LOCUS358881, partial [marine metagenome]